jgi:SAM-dependent methyltransferase
MGPVAEGLVWQIGGWDQMAPVYIREIDQRFAPVVEHLIGRAELKPGQHVSIWARDRLGRAAGGARHRTGRARQGGRHQPGDAGAGATADRQSSPDRYQLRGGRTETLPVQVESIDVVVACLSLMYVIDRAAAAREIARVLRPRPAGSGRMGETGTRRHRAAAADGRQFAPEPPVPGVGPGALADPAPL